MSLNQTAVPTAQLLRENVWGHTRKVNLLRNACDRLRARRGRGLSVLDVGCGSGYAVTRYLGQPGDEVLGIDLHEPNIRYAQRSFAGPGLRFECRSAESLIDARAQYDVVVLADVLEHLDQPGAVLANCRRLLRADGLLLITVPNGYGPFETESALARLPVLGPLLLKSTEYLVAALNKLGPLKGKWTDALSEVPADLPYNAESGHVQFFTRGRLTQLAADAGIGMTYITGLSFLSGPFTNFLLGASAGFCRWNVAVAGRLPPAAVSSWFFEGAPLRDPQRPPA